MANTGFSELVSAAKRRERLVVDYFAERRRLGGNFPARRALAETFRHKNADLLAVSDAAYGG